MADSTDVLEKSRVHVDDVNVNVGVAVAASGGLVGRDDVSHVGTKPVTSTESTRNKNAILWIKVIVAQSGGAKNCVLDKYGWVGRAATS